MNDIIFLFQLNVTDSTNLFLYWTKFYFCY